MRDHKADHAAPALLVAISRKGYLVVSDADAVKILFLVEVWIYCETHVGRTFVKRKQKFYVKEVVTNMPYLDEGCTHEAKDPSVFQNTKHDKQERSYADANNSKYVPGRWCR